MLLRHRANYLTLQKYRLLGEIPPCFPLFQGSIAILYTLSLKWIVSNYDAVVALATQAMHGVLPSCNKTTHMTLFFILSSLYLIYRTITSSAIIARHLFKKNTGSFHLSASASADADVIIVGMGTAGATLGVALARQGKRILIIEKTPELVESIKGELLQPGGVRVLERLNLGACAKSAEIDAIRVDGYVVITPASDSTLDGSVPSKSEIPEKTTAAKETELYLFYPDRDPDTLLEYMGKGATYQQTGKSSVCDTTGVDACPRGRSFYNSRFVQNLRNEVHKQGTIRVVYGEVRSVLTQREILQAHESASQTIGTPSGVVDLKKRMGYHPAPAPGIPANWTTDPNRVVGVLWADKDNPQEKYTSLAPLTVIADGNFSGLRRNIHSHKPTVVSNFCGLLLEHPPYEKPEDNTTPLPYPHNGHVVLVRPSPVLFYQISKVETRVLVDVPKLPDTEDALRDYFLNTVAPQLPLSLREPFIKAAKTQEPICMQNRSLPGSTPLKKGVVMVGDTLNMRHPLTGGGMTVALKDVELFSKCISSLSLATGNTSTLSLYDESAIDDAIALFHNLRRGHAATVNILANALYKVFSSPFEDDGRRSQLRDACVAYMSAGGVLAAGPVGLLSGITPKPAVLVSHFFAVAFHALYLALCPFPTPSRILLAYKILHVACCIIMPMLEVEQTTFLSSKPLLFITNILFPWRGREVL